MRDVTREVTEERFDRLESIIREKQFMNASGYGNEMLNYVFDYPANDEIYVRERIQQLTSKLKKNNSETKIQVFDLYEIIIGILKEKGYFDICVKFEKKRGFQSISKSVLEMLRVTEGADNLIIKYIKERYQEKNILFLIGVGKCYPIVKSHVVINNMQTYFEETPVILFYPGKYDGRQLMLFNKIEDDSQYKAKLIVE